MTVTEAKYVSDVLFTNNTHISPLQESYEQSFAKIWVKIDHVIMAPHCTSYTYMPEIGVIIAVKLSICKLLHYYSPRLTWYHDNIAKNFKLLRNIKCIINLNINACMHVCGAIMQTRWKMTHINLNIPEKASCEYYGYHCLNWHTNVHTVD